MPDYTDPTEPGFTPPSQTQNEQFLKTLTGGALRIDANNNIQIRVVASAGTPDDGGATLPYGASNALGHGMAQIRIDGVNVVMDININGDVYTTSLGTAQPPPRTYVFVVIGQSNAVGRATDNNSAVYSGKVRQLSQSNILLQASSPLDHFDEQPGSMGFARRFCADFLTVNDRDQIVLVPRAQGGTALQTGFWLPGGTGYDTTVDDTNALFISQPDFVLGGFLWNQGENDVGNASYAAQLQSMINGLRTDITVADANTPFVLGRVHPSSNAWDATIDGIIRDIPLTVPATSVVAPDAGNYTLFDNLHYDGNSLDRLGSSYYLHYNRVLAPLTPEAGATEHYVIGYDNFDYSSLVGSKQMSPQNAAPVLDKQFATVLGQANGLRSDTVETTAFTWVGVFRVAGTCIVQGTISGTSGNSLYYSSGELFYNARGAVGQQTIISGLSPNEWVFAAVCSDGTGYGVYTVYNGNKTWSTYDEVRTVTNGPLYGLAGDLYYNSGPFTANSDYAEVMTFSGIRKTESELDDIYGRSLARLAGRGVNIQPIA